MYNWECCSRIFEVQVRRNLSVDGSDRFRRVCHMSNRIKRDNIKWYHRILDVAGKRVGDPLFVSSSRMSSSTLT